MIIAAQRKGVRKVIIPAGNLQEASLAQQSTVIIIGERLAICELITKLF